MATHLHLLKVDRQQSVLGCAGFPARVYSPYGIARWVRGPSSGFVGQWYEPSLVGYHLGNGRRAYAPSVMRLQAADALSPFGAGGTNSYAYCLGDPINRTDPTGQESSAAESWLALSANALALFVSGLRLRSVWVDRQLARTRTLRPPTSAGKAEIGVSLVSGVASLVGISGAVDYLSGGRSAAFDYVGYVATAVALTSTAGEAWLLYKRRPLPQGQAIALNSIRRHTSSLGES